MLTIFSPLLLLLAQFSTAFVAVEISSLWVRICTQHHFSMRHHHLFVLISSLGGVLLPLCRREVHESVSKVQMGLWLQDENSQQDGAVITEMDSNQRKLETEL